jgi:hypothetical protein
MRTDDFSHAYGDNGRIVFRVDAECFQDETRDGCDVFQVPGAVRADHHGVDEIPFHALGIHIGIVESHEI